MIPPLTSCHDSESWHEYGHSDYISHQIIFSMKNHLIILLSVLLFACGGNKTETKNDFSDITFKMDTIMVDPREEILFLKWGISLSDLSSDKKFLFNFNLDDYTIEKINLDKLVLEEKLSFEKEGPNGTGDNISSIKLYKEDQVFFSGFNSIGLFNLTGEKIKDYPLNNFKFKGDSLSEDESFNWRMILDNEGKYLFGIISSYTGESYSFGKLDFENKTLKKIPIKSFDIMKDYNFILQSMMVIMPDMNLMEWDDKLILSNSVSSELSWFDFQQDTLFSKTYQSSLTADGKKGKYRNEVESVEELEKEQKAMQQEINFMVPFWDEVNQRFYRFSYAELDIEADSENGEKAKSKVYLTIMDKELNFLGESHVPVLDKSPGKHFAKDGKIWIHENINDEMGFVRLSFD